MLVDIICTSLLIFLVYLLVVKNRKNKTKIIPTDASQIDNIPRKKSKVIITLEDSWKFLTEITEAVMFSFSKQDQKLVLDLGKMLSKSGMLYQHVLEYGISSFAVNPGLKKNEESKTIQQL